LIDIALQSQVLPHAPEAPNPWLCHVSGMSVSFPPTLTNTSRVSTRHDVSTYRGQVGHGNTYLQVRAYLCIGHGWSMIRLYSNLPVQVPFPPPLRHIRLSSSIMALVSPILRVKISTLLGRVSPRDMGPSNKTLYSLPLLSPLSDIVVYPRFCVTCSKKA
jgi:hypothetical protein